jgi:hypothetical protein
MIWFQRKETKLERVATQRLADPKAADREQILSQALSEYETHFYNTVSAALDQDAEKAKQIVRQAREFVTSSRLAYALCRPVLEHVQYWPSWCTHKDFYSTYCTAPFGYIEGVSRRSEKPAITVVTFSYNSTSYTIKLIDEGMFEFATDDMNSYGKVELIFDKHIVLGLDIRKDLAKEFDHWWMTDVYALLPGHWMKELIEMAAYIDGMRTRESERFRNQDALERAARIRLPRG